MGRKMFGPVEALDRGTTRWRGWWGENPPYHAPVFVLTHHEREPIEMEGGTTFHFVTDGFDAAYARASRPPATARSSSRAARRPSARRSRPGVLDEIVTDVSPMMLGGGERLFDGIADPGLVPVEVTWSPRATHIRYRVGGA